MISSILEYSYCDRVYNAAANISIYWNSGDPCNRIQHVNEHAIIWMVLSVNFVFAMFWMRILVDIVHGYLRAYSNNIEIGWVSHRSCHVWRHRSKDNTAKAAAIALCDKSSHEHLSFWKNKPKMIVEKQKTTFSLNPRRYFHRPSASCDIAKWRRGDSIKRVRTMPAVSD